MLKLKGLFDPEHYRIGQRLSEKMVYNEIKLIPESTYGIRVPLKKSLKLFLEIPGVFNQIITYMESLKKEKYLISNII